MSAWEQVVEMMTREQTPVQSTVNLVTYTWFTVMGGVAGWLMHKIRGKRP